MTEMAHVETAWFACLLQLPQGNLVSGGGGSRRRVVKVPSLMFDVIDEANDQVVVSAGDKIEVESDKFGTTWWEVDGEPEPLATLYDVLGYQVQIKRVSQGTIRPVVTP